MKGIYVLLISISKGISVNVGALGAVDFEKGMYAYVGSAQSSLEKRVDRHLGKVKRKFWHIDYLLDNVEVNVLKVFWKEAGRLEECQFSRKVAERGISIRGFGSSDCRCESHLFKIEDYGFLREFTHEIPVKPVRKAASMAKAGWCVWVTGLPGSGKSVVSEALLALLDKKGIHAQMLSSDALRKAVTPRPSYSLEERDVVYATLVYIAVLLTQNGVNVVIDATGNLRRYRESARKQISKFIEAYLECPLEVCVEREAKRGKTYQAPKQIYTRAQRGKAPTVPGIGQPYEPPSNPEITIDTTKCTPEECARKILEAIFKMFHQNCNA